MTRTPDALVVGGGIAGLAAAHALARARVGRVLLLEREPLPCLHASGRNAAIYRQLVHSPAQVLLALRSRTLLDELFAGERCAWLRSTGSLLVSAQPGGGAALAVLRARAVEAGVAAEPVGARALRGALPWLRRGQVRAGLWVPGDGVLDVHAITTQLRQAAQRAGVTVELGTGVAGLSVQQGRVVGVRCEDGSLRAAGRVVLAAGAWAAALGAGAGAPLPLTPLRRHLVQLQVEHPLPLAPVVWRVDAEEEAYVRPESGGVLASPCDEDAHAAALPPVRPEALELLAARLCRLAPGLASAQVVRSWACLRTFAPDREPVVGEDPRVRGLAWLAGLGGHGMSAGLAAAELLALALHGRAPPLAAVLTPARLLVHAPARAPEH